MSQPPSPPTTTDRGVSPVIGVVLMVAVTVALATTVGVSALGPIQGPTHSKVASFSVSADADTDTISLTHVGGDSLRASEVTIVVANGSVRQRFEPVSGAARLTPGDTATIDLAPTGGNNRVDWNGSPGSWEYNRTATFDGIDAGERLEVYVVIRGDVLFRGAVPVYDLSGGSPATPVPDQDPVADFTYDRKGASENVDLDAGPSSDPDGGSITTYEWDGGADGDIDYTGETLNTVEIEDLEDGPVPVRLIVTDDEGATNSTTKTVS